MIKASKTSRQTGLGSAQAERLALDFGLGIATATLREVLLPSVIVPTTLLSREY